jgi:magnesium-transporting ATPase (P-type)
MESMMINAIKRIKKCFKTWSENKLFRAIVASIQQLFIILLVTYLVLLLIETIFAGSVSRYLNLNYWLIVVITTGVITILSRQESEKPKEKSINKGNIITLVCIGLIGAALIWYKTREIGWLSYLISLAGGILIVLLSLLIWQKDEEEESEGENSPHN